MPRGGAGQNRKPDDQAANRRGARRQPTPRVVSIGRAAAQPDLPDGYDWPEETGNWWSMWGRSPLAENFTEIDWSELLDTARFHAMIWDPEVPLGAMLKAGAEVRRRGANFGATPLDRQRLRISLVMADEAEEKREADAPSSARARRGPLRQA